MKADTDESISAGFKSRRGEKDQNCAGVSHDFSAIRDVDGRRPGTVNHLTDNETIKELSSSA